MNRLSVFFAATFIFPVIVFGCSGGGSNPVTPDESPSLEMAIGAYASESSSPGSVTHLWGYYDVWIDPASRCIEAVPRRHAMFTANVVNILNGKPAGLSFHINGTSSGPDYVDIDIDVAITHPFPGVPGYRGYDVRGVFMGDGSAAMAYNPALKYAVLGVDQFMPPDPMGGHGAPDGYTRWFNFSEFSTGGMPLFSYTPGKLAYPGFDGTATVCPYKYFADGLDVNEDLWAWLNNNAGERGVFSSGATNERGYYLRFPNGKGVRYGYAVIANWSGPESWNHPSNAPEAVACKVEDESDLWFEDGTQNGGAIKFDVSVWDWDAAASGGVMEDYRILVESNVLSDVYEFDADDMTPIGGNDNYSTYHVEIPADDIQGVDGNEMWVIVEDQHADYSNDYGVVNKAWDNQLAAFFRCDLDVNGETPAWIEVTSPNGGEEWVPGTEEEITWTSGGLTGTVFLEYSKDAFASDVHLIDSGIDVAVGSYLWTVACDPSDSVRVRASWTDDDEVNDVSDDDFTIVDSGWAVKWGDVRYEEGRFVDFDAESNVYLAGTHRHPTSDRNYGFLVKYDACGQLLWDQTWGGTGHTQGYGVAVDDGGTAYVTGNFYGTTDFDPDDPGGPNRISSVATWDAWLNVFDTNGDFVWVRTWGGGYSDEGRGVTLDSVGDVYVAGSYSLTVDFDPGGGDQRTSNGSFDLYVCKYDPDGNYQWVKTWGGPEEDRAWGVGAGTSRVYATGFFRGTNVNFNPDGSHLLSSNGGEDIFLSAFDTSGGFQWAHNWGGPNAGIQTDEGNGVSVDGYDAAYATGYFVGSSIDFDPTAGSDPHSSNGARDAFVSKFDSSGGFLWARTWGGSSHDSGQGVSVDGSGNVYVTGYFWLATDLDPGGGDVRSAVGFIDAYLSKLDSAGMYQWGLTWGGSTDDRGFGVNVDGSGNTYATGFFSGTTDFAPGDPPCNEPPHNLTPVGNADAYLSKHFPDGCW